MGLLVLTIAVVGIAMLAMAVGALFSNRCLRGSCGGPEVLGPDGEPLSCDTCPLKGRTDEGRMTVRRTEAADGPGGAGRLIHRSRERPVHLEMQASKILTSPDREISR